MVLEGEQLYIDATCLQHLFINVAVLMVYLRCLVGDVNLFAKGFYLELCMRVCRSLFSFLQLAFIRGGICTHVAITYCYVSVGVTRIYLCISWATFIALSCTCSIYYGVHAWWSVTASVNAVMYIRCRCTCIICHLLRFIVIVCYQVGSSIQCLLVALLVIIVTLVHSYG